MKSVNVKAMPGVESKYNAYGNKVKVIYTPDKVREDFESTTSVNINRRVFVISSNSESLPVEEVLDACDIDPCFCLLTSYGLSAKEKKELVDEFPECQKCFDLIS